MTVTDDQFAALGALLAGDYDGHRRLMAGLDSRGELAGYTAVVTAAFVQAVDRRFGPGHRDDAAVREFVSGVRSRYPGADRVIDQAAAERVICKALGRGSISDIAGEVIRHTERLLLPLMLADERLSGEELGRFLASARALLDA